MTPPKVTNNEKSFLDWAPGQDAASVDAQDCSNCHTSPQPQGNFGFQNQPNPFFLDYAKKSKSVLSPQDAEILKAWVAGNSAPAAPANPPAAKPATAAVANPIVAAPPADAAGLADQAKELERQARLSLDPEKKSAFYQSALGLRLLAGDAKATTAVLDELQATYKKSGHAAGEKFVAALRLWADGKAEESLKALAEMEKDAQGSAYAFYQAYGAQRSLLLQVAAGEKLKQNDYPGAKTLLLEALRLTPSDRLTSRVLKLMAEHGEANLLKQSLRLADLEAQRTKLTTPPVRCNVGCHSASEPDPFKDFPDYGPLLKDEFGRPLFQGPDLSAYRKFTHLTHAQKLQLHDLDQEIGELRTKYLRSLEEVRTLLFTKTLDDPKADLAVLEEKALKDAVAFTGPDRSLPWQLAGEAYLAKQDYAKAVSALEAAVAEDPSRVDAQFALGKARFAAGDFQGSRDAYSAVLSSHPRDTVALRFRADANAHYLAGLDPKKDADEIAKVEGEMASDRALLLALLNAGEKDKIAALGKQLDLLRTGGEAPLETRKETLAMIELMAKQYLALAETPRANVAEAELVRKELNGLAAKTFELLAGFAKEDSDPEIKKRSGLYSGYALLAEGKTDDAVKLFEPLRADLPEVDKILGTLEKNKLRMVNLAALDAWATYNKEGAAVQADAQNGILGSAIGGIESWFRDDGKDFRDDTKAKWKAEVAFVAELRARIESGKANTILQAMEQIEKDGPESMKAEARYYINYEDKVVTGFPLGALVHLVDKLPPEPGEAETLLNKTWDLERQNPAIETPYAFYTLVNFLDQEASFNGTAREHMDALEGNGSFGRSAFKFITSMSPESLAVDVLLMVGSAGLGNLAKLAALSRLEKAGVTGYKALVLAGAVGVGVEGTALWAANLTKEAMIKDPSKVFTQEHMLKSYGATLIMIGGLKGAGKLGESLAPRAARSLGLVSEGGTKLTAGGKVLTWSIGHGTGLAGMVATSHVNQGLGLTPKPVGGWKEGLVHDVFGYVQFAVAHKMADAAFSGKLSTISNKQHSEIAVREAILTAKSYADALGFRAARNAKGEIVDSPARKLVVGMLVDASLNKVGFSGGKLAKLVESRQFAKANEYFAEFGLPLEYSKSGQLVAVARGEAAPHAAAGIPAGKPKPRPKATAGELYAKQLAEKAAAWMDKAAEWLFGPPGDGGFGGMQPAYAGAYGAAKVRAPKAEPQKGPYVAKMADGSGGWGGGAHKSLEKFEGTLVEKDIFDISHNGTPEKNPNAIRVGLESKEGLNSVAEALKGEIPAELKRVEILLGKEIGLNDLAGLIQSAKDKGLDLYVYEPANTTQPRYQFVGRRFLAPDEAAAKRLAEDALKSGQNVEIAFSENSKTLVKIEGDKIQVNFKAKDKGEQVEMLAGVLSGGVQGKRNITLEWGGQTFSVRNSGGRVEIKGSAGEVLLYVPAGGNYRARLEIQLPRGADAERAAVLLRVAGDFEPAQLKGANVLVEGLDLGLGGPVKGNLSQLIQKSLWGEVASLQVGKGKDIFLDTAVKGTGLAYNFSTKLPFEQGHGYLAEHLAFESAKALGAAGPADAKTALMQRHFRAAAREVLEQHLAASQQLQKLRADAAKGDSRANAKIPDQVAKVAQFQPFVDGNYSITWTAAAEKLADFAAKPKQREQLNEVLAKIRDFSQRDANAFLEFKPFDGRAYADNAFEMTRIFADARANASIDLPKVLKHVDVLFGTEGKVEVYGAGVGMVYKAKVLGDKAAENEFNRFLNMKREAVASGEGYRFSIIPEDRTQGSSYGTDKFTKTPEWVVEKLDADGKTTQLAAVEVMTRDGSLTNAFEIEKAIADKVFQITGHEFGKSHNQGDGLIVLRLYKAAGRETALMQMVTDALRTEYRQNASKARAKEKIRVMVILEDGSFPGGAKTRWLDYDRAGNWVERNTGGVTEASGSAWAEPFHTAMGW